MIFRSPLKTDLITWLDFWYQSDNHRIIALSTHPTEKREGSVQRMNRLTGLNSIDMTSSASWALSRPIVTSSMSSFLDMFHSCFRWRQTQLHEWVRRAHNPKFEHHLVTAWKRSAKSRRRVDCFMPLGTLWCTTQKAAVVLKTETRFSPDGRK